MDDKAEAKMTVHQALIKNGFYRLPMHSLSQILKILDMPQSLEPKTIQDNAINGLIKVIQKYNNKFSDHLNLPKNATITKQTKQYVGILLQDIFNSITKKSSLPTVTPITTPMSPIGAPLPPMYSPLAQAPYMRPPVMPANSKIDSINQNQNMKLLEQQQLRYQQQMYMYYYSMYGGYPPMFNPNMGYMNPYGSFGQMPINKSMPPINPMNPMNPMNSMNSMNPMNSMSQMNSMNQMSPMHSMNQLTAMNAMNMKYSQLQGSQGTKANQINKNYQQQMQNGLINSQKIGNVNKQAEKNKFSVINKQNQQQVGKKADHGMESQSIFNNKGSIQSIPSFSPQLEQKKSEKKKNVEDKQKLNIQNPPFIVAQSPAGKKSNISNRENIKSSPINEPNPLLRYCSCKGISKFEEQFLCAICNRTFHYQCLREPFSKHETKESIECYHCRMRFIDPLNKVKEVIGQYYIPTLSENKFSIQCNLKPYQYLCRQKGNKYQIEMRCLKVSANDNNEITWPDQCMIKLNGERIIEIPALQINSSLKKRKDYSILITQNIYNKNIQPDSHTLEKVKLSLQIKSLTKQEISQKKIKNSFTFAFAIYFVEKLTVDQLFLKIINQQKVAEPVDYLQRLMQSTENDVQIDKIAISLRDPFTWDVIKTPVRGQKCQHGQCFDLKTFISFMSTARNRTWKCPVCSKDAKRFMIDLKQQDLIKTGHDNNLPVPSEVAFMKDGTIMSKKASQMINEEDDLSESKLQKTKKIRKQPKVEVDSKEIHKQKISQQCPQSKNQIAEAHIVVEVENVVEDVVENAVEDVVENAVENVVEDVVEDVVENAVENVVENAVEDVN